MIEDLFGNIGQQQEELKKKLDEIIISHSSPQGLVRIELSASKKIFDISIDESKWKELEKEEVEDLLLITLNEALEKADILAGEKTKNIINDMLPPGLGNMFGA